MPEKPNTTVVVDFSSPNVAKPMHLGHLRATVVGRSICELARTQGHKVIGLNHLGDWGSQFGALICAYKKWHNAYSFERADAFESLYALYVRFHKESTPELKAQGAAEFKKLEQGDAQNTKLWQEFKKLSLKEYNKIWHRLDVKHDLLLPESFYNDKLLEVKELLLKYDLLKKDQGALIVALPPPLPPCLIAKSDGASLYATRDIAAALYRMQKLKATHNFYVVGSEQKLHFKQVFGVLAQLPAQFQHCQHKHISFGRYRFLDSGMSSRKGQIVRAEDVLRQAKERVIKIIKTKNPHLPNLDQTAETIGTGAIVFNDLKVDCKKDVEFSWEKTLNTKGNSGPYLQYVVVRCMAVLEKLRTINFAPKAGLCMGARKWHPCERALLLELLQFKHTLHLAAQQQAPHILASYLLDLAGKFNSFYSSCPIVPASSPALPEHHVRYFLVQETRYALVEGLRILGIRCPARM